MNGTAVVLQRAKQRISVDLIARTSQNAAGVVAGEVVPQGGERAASLKMVPPEAPALRTVSPTCAVSSMVEDSPAVTVGCRVTAQGAVSQRHRSTKIIYPTAKVVAGDEVAAERPVYYQAIILGIVPDAAATATSRIATDGATGYGQISRVPTVPDATAICPRWSYR